MRLCTRGIFLFRTYLQYIIHLLQNLRKRLSHAAAFTWMLLPLPLQIPAFLHSLIRISLMMATVKEISDDKSYKRQRHQICVALSVVTLSGSVKSRTEGFALLSNLSDWINWKKLAEYQVISFCWMLNDKRRYKWWGNLIKDYFVFGTALVLKLILQLSELIIKKFVENGFGLALHNER